MKKREQLNTSFTIRSESDLFETFRKRDRKFLVPPEHASYPLRVEHYLAWTDPDGNYAYMVFRKPQWEIPIGLVFDRRDKGSVPSTGRLCDWCHSYGSTAEIGLLTVSPTKRLTAGVLLCRDLSCMAKTEEIAALAGKPFDRMANDVCYRIAAFFDNIRGRMTDEFEAEAEADSESDADCRVDSDSESDRK